MTEDNADDWEDKIDAYEEAVKKIGEKIDLINDKKKNLTYFQKQVAIMQRRRHEYKEMYKKMHNLHSVISKALLDLKDGKASSLDVFLSSGSTKKKPEQVEEIKLESESEDKRFSKYENGIIKDHTTGLEWFVHPQDTDINWNDADEWVKSLNEESFAGGNWKLPTMLQLRGDKKQIKGIYQKEKGKHNLDPIFGFFKTHNNWLRMWSCEIVDKNNESDGKLTDSPRARCFSFNLGDDYWRYRNYDCNMRVFSVRVG